MPRAERPSMPEYGVPDSLDGVLDWEWAGSRLERSRNYWVATASAAGRPHAMPVWGIWLPETERFVFSCGGSSRKARNLRENPGVVVTADDTVEVVSLEGTAAETRTADIPETVERLAAKYESDPEKRAALVAFLADTTAFEVTPERAFGIIERPDEFGPKATRWVW